MGTFILFILVMILFARMSGLNSRVSALEGDEPVKSNGVEKVAIVAGLIFLALAFLLAISASVEAHDWDYYYDDEPVEIYEVYPTRPGTSIRDYSQPGYYIERK